MNQVTKWSVFAVVFMLASCVSLTVNINFPAAEIRSAAEKIEDRVRGGEDGGNLQSYLRQLFKDARRPAITIDFGGKSAYAQGDLKLDIETPEITKIIDSRAKRYKKELKPELDNGNLGEAMTGFVIIRDQKAHDLKALAALKKLAKDENDDREKLYKEILKENKLDVTEETMKKVQELFFKAIVKKMEVGHWYQKDKDTWLQKTEEDKERDKQQ